MLRKEKLKKESNTCEDMEAAASTTPQKPDWLLPDHSTKKIGLAAQKSSQERRSYTSPNTARPLLRDTRGRFASPASLPKTIKDASRNALRPSSLQEVARNAKKTSTPLLVDYSYGDYVKIKASASGIEARVGWKDQYISIDSLIKLYLEMMSIALPENTSLPRTTITLLTELARGNPVPTIATLLGAMQDYGFKFDFIARPPSISASFLVEEMNRAACEVSAVGVGAGLSVCFPDGTKKINLVCSLGIAAGYATENISSQNTHRAGRSTKRSAKLSFVTAEYISTQPEPLPALPPAPIEVLPDTQAAYPIAIAPEAQTGNTLRFAAADTSVNMVEAPRSMIDTETSSNTQATYVMTIAPEAQTGDTLRFAAANTSNTSVDMAMDTSATPPAPHSLQFGHAALSRPQPSLSLADHTVSIASGSEAVVPTNGSTTANRANIARADYHTQDQSTSVSASVGLRDSRNGVALTASVAVATTNPVLGGILVGATFGKIAYDMIQARTQPELLSFLDPSKPEALEFSRLLQKAHDAPDRATAAKMVLNGLPACQAAHQHDPEAQRRLYELEYCLKKGPALNKEFIHNRTLLEKSSSQAAQATIHNIYCDELTQRTDQINTASLSCRYDDAMQLADNAKRDFPLEAPRFEMLIADLQQAKQFSQRIGQIDEASHSGRYDDAMQLAENAKRDFPREAPQLETFISSMRDAKQQTIITAQPEQNAVTADRVFNTSIHDDQAKLEHAVMSEAEQHAQQSIAKRPEPVAVETNQTPVRQISPEEIEREAKRLIIAIVQGTLEKKLEEKRQWAKARRTRSSRAEANALVGMYEDYVHAGELGLLCVTIKLLSTAKTVAPAGTALIAAAPRDPAVWKAAGGIVVNFFVRVGTEIKIGFQTLIGQTPSTASIAGRMIPADWITVAIIVVVAVIETGFEIRQRHIEGCEKIEIHFSLMDAQHTQESNQAHLREIREITDRWTLSGTMKRHEKRAILRGEVLKPPTEIDPDQIISRLQSLNGEKKRSWSELWSWIKEYLSGYPTKDTNNEQASDVYFISSTLQVKRSELEKKLQDHRKNGQFKEVARTRKEIKIFDKKHYNFCIATPKYHNESDVEACFGWRRLSDTLFDRAAVFRHFQRAFELDRTRPEYAIFYANEQCLRMKYDDARATLQACLDKNQSNQEATTLLTQYQTIINYRQYDARAFAINRSVNIALSVIKKLANQGTNWLIPAEQLSGLSESALCFFKQSMQLHDMILSQSPVISSFNHAQFILSNYQIALQLLCVAHGLSDTEAVPEQLNKLCAAAGSAKMGVSVMRTIYELLRTDMSWQQGGLSLCATVLPLLNQYRFKKKRQYGQAPLSWYGILVEDAAILLESVPISILLSGAHNATALLEITGGVLHAVSRPGLQKFLQYLDGMLIERLPDLLENVFYDVKNSRKLSVATALTVAAITAIYIKFRQTANQTHNETVRQQIRQKMHENLEMFVQKVQAEFHDNCRMLEGQFNSLEQELDELEESATNILRLSKQALCFTDKKRQIQPALTTFNDAISELRKRMDDIDQHCDELEKIDTVLPQNIQQQDVMHFIDESTIRDKTTPTIEYCKTQLSELKQIIQKPSENFRNALDQLEKNVNHVVEKLEATTKYATPGGFTLSQNYKRRTGLGLCSLFSTNYKPNVCSNYVVHASMMLP